MSYTANAKALQKQITKMAKTDPVWLERIKTIKAKGIKGWDCIYQAVSDFKLEKQATCEEKELGLNRVELAFNRLGEIEKRDLLTFAKQIAAERRVKFDVKYFQALREFSQDERACIATALARMQAVRQAFPPNLRVNEFHPKAQGTKKWLY